MDEAGPVKKMLLYRTRTRPKINAYGWDSQRYCGPCLLHHDLVEPLASRGIGILHGDGTARAQQL